jgi:Fic family protein
MALARAEASPARFYSLSTQIEADKKAYYLTLEKTQKGGMDITGWLLWFLDCMDRAIQGAETALAVILRKSVAWERINGQFQANDRQRAVVNQLLDGPEPEFSTSRYAKIAKCSLDTALRDINTLADAGIVLRGTSGGRSTKYSLAP